MDQLAKGAFDHDIDPLTTVHCADLKPLVNSYIKQEVQTKWDVSIHGRDLYLVKPTLGPPKKFQHLTRAEEVVITWLWIGYIKATKSHILSRGPLTTCQHCGQTLTIEHMLLECTVLQQNRDECLHCWLTGDPFWDNPRGLHSRDSEKTGFYYLIWMAIYPEQSLIQICHQATRFWTWFNPCNNTRFCNLFIELNQLWENPTCEGLLICLGGNVSSFNKCSPIQDPTTGSSTGGIPTTTATSTAEWPAWNGCPTSIHQ